MTDFKKLVVNRNMGKIFIDLSMLDKFPNEVQLVLSKLLIKSATCDFAHEKMTYVGNGECFRPTSIGQVIPTYDVLFKFSEDDKLEGYELIEVDSNKYY